MIEMNFEKKQLKFAPNDCCKRQIQMKFTLFMLIFFSFQQYLFAQNPNPNTTLDIAILNEMNTRNFPGASTLIVKNGEVVWVESYGYADVTNAVSVEDTTVFLLASVSKLFTGTAAMQLHENNTINIDTDLNNYLPWSVQIPNFTNDSITARQLMTHTASIDDNWGVMGSFYGYPDPTISLSDCMTGYFTTSGTNYDASGNFLNAAPGTSYDYSNMGSALNGYLVEASTGIPFDDYCDNNIFDKLCMVNTAWHFSDFNPGQVATPHNFQNGSYNAINQYGFADYPNGQLRSTAMDLGNYMIAFLNGGTLGNNTILSSTSVNEMLSLQIPVIDSVSGLNWHKTKLYHSGGETMVWGHSGGEQGVSTYLYIDPQNDLGICLLTNGEGDGLYICDALYDHALNGTLNNGITPNCGTLTSINQYASQTNQITIYPNPAKNFIQVKTETSEEAWFKIHTLTGQLVMSGNTDGPNAYIKLPELPAGLYVFQLENKEPQLIEIN
jgi:CubicO group peptidase (beta-lactamase class C family)